MAAASFSVTPEVLIVGAGPSGLILALSLLRNGIAIRIIDKELTHRVGAKGAGIAPRSMELYKLLGLWPDIEEQALRTPPKRLYAQPEGRQPIKTWHQSEYAAPTPAYPFNNPLMLGQDHLEGIIRNHIEKHYGVSIELGTELVTFEQDDECVNAHLRKRVGEQKNTTEEIIQVKYLAGTDGGRSGVRKRLGLSFLGETRDESWLLYGDVDVEGLDKEHWHTWGNFSTGAVMLRPPDGANSRYFAFVATAAGMSEADVKAIGADTTRAEQHFRGVSGRTDIKFVKWLYLTAHRPNIRMVDTFQKGRVFLAGDAAHTHSPTGGQGLNSSVQDSFNLAWKLALVLKGSSHPSLLDSYTAERLPVIAEMLQRTTMLLDKTLAAPASGVPDTTSEDSGFRRGRALYQLGVNYRWSDIVLDERTAKPGVTEGAYGAVGGAQTSPVRAGDRAPDAPGLVVLGGEQSAPSVTTLFDVFRSTCHTVLLFVPAAQAPAAATAPFLETLLGCAAGTVRIIAVLASTPEDGAQLLRADLVVVDKEGHACAGYATTEALGVVAVIVRPDGVIGGIALGEDGVRRYLKGVFKI